MTRARAVIRALPAGHMLARLLLPQRRSAIVLRLALIAALTIVAA